MMIAKQRSLYSLLSIMLFDHTSLTMTFPILTLLFFDEQSRLFPAETSHAVRSLWYGFCVAMPHLINIVCAPLLSALSDEWGRKKVLLVATLGAAIFALTAAFGIFYGLLSVLFLGRVIQGLFSRTNPIAQAIIGDIASADHKMVWMGYLQLAISTGAFLGPMMAGYFAKQFFFNQFNFSLPFFIAAFLAGISALLTYFFFKETLSISVSFASDLKHAEGVSLVKEEGRSCASTSTSVPSALAGRGPQRSLLAVPFSLVYRWLQCSLLAISSFFAARWLQRFLLAVPSPLVGEGARRADEGCFKSFSHKLTSFKYVFFNPSVFRISMILLFSQISWSFYYQFMPPILKTVLGFNPHALGVFVGFIALWLALATAFGLNLLKRWFDLNRLLTVSLYLVLIGVLLTFLFCSLPLSNKNQFMVWVAAIPTAMGDVMAYSCLTTLYSDAVSKAEQGKVMGVCFIVVGIIWSLTALLGGYLMSIHPLLPLIVAPLGIVIAIILLQKSIFFRFLKYYLK